MRHGWVFAAWLVLLLLAFGVGLAHLADYGADYDEGALLQTAVLAHEGYSLYDPVVLNKPPLLVWWVQMFFALAGPTVSAARLGVLLLNLIGLAALGALAAAWWRHWAGPTAVLLFLLLPEALPRLASVTPDLPAMSLMLLALLAAGRAGKRWGLTAVAGLFFGLGLGVHPVLLFMGLPIGLALLGQNRKANASWPAMIRVNLSGLLLFGLMATAVTLLWLAIVDGEGFRHWVITYNRAPLDATLTAVAAKNGSKIAAFFRQQGALALLAAFGAALSPLAAPNRRFAVLVCLVWLAAALFTLQSLQPMWEHYLIFLAYPLVLLASGGLATAVADLRHRPGPTRNRLRTILPLMAAGLLLLFYAAANLAAARPWGTWPPGYQETVAGLQKELEPGSFILTDEPFLAFAAGLRVPPSLADSSTKRIATSFLQPVDVINAHLAYEVRYGLWGNGRYQQLPSLTTWAESASTSSRPVGDLRLYTFAVLTPTHRLVSRLEPGIHLRGYGLHPAAAGQSPAITLFWETAVPLPADYKIFIHLLDGRGNLVAQQDADPLGGWLPTGRWAPGVVVPHTAVIPLPPEAAPPYTLATGMYTWPDVARLPAFQADGTRWPDDLVIIGQFPAAAMIQSSP